MKKEIITFDELAAFSFLKFVKLDEIDMTLLIRSINNIAEIKIKDDTNEYYITSKGQVMLSKRYIEKFNKNVDIELFENAYTKKTYQYIENINMLEFVLRKIKLLGEGCVIKEDITSIFSSIQLRALNKLYQEKYIIDYLHKDKQYQDYEAIKLTKRGELQLFLIDNKEVITTFIQLLESNGYNPVVLEAFLITQDLEKSAVEVLNLENFVTFYNEFDINPYQEESNCSRVRTKKQFQ